MIDRAVIPDRDVASRPATIHIILTKLDCRGAIAHGDSPPPDCGVSLLSKTVLQERKNHVTFCLRYAYQPSDKTRIDKHRLHTSNRVDTDNGMDSLNGLATGNLGEASSRRGLIKS